MNIVPRLFIVSVLVLSSLIRTTAAEAARIRMRGIGKEYSIPEGGIKLRVPAGTESRLLPALTVRASRRSDGALFYRTLDLWRHTQLLALWGGQGTTAVLARVKFPPEKRPDELCLAADYQSSRKNCRRVPGDHEISEWAAQFFDITVSGISPADINGELKWRRLKTDQRRNALFFGYGTENGELRMYMLRIGWEKAGVGSDAEWIRLAERCAASVCLIPVRHAAGEKPGTYAERLAQAQKSISGMRGWYIRETPNYIFATNQRNRSDMRRLQNDLELARELFKRYFPPAAERCGVGVVKLFAERGEYLRYVGQNLQWTAGIWNSGVRELIVSPLGGKADDRIAEKHLREVALHEGFHQYIFYAANEIDPALWFNEGCAQFFETSQLRQGEAGVLDKNTESKLAGAAQAAGTDLKRFVSLDHKGFYSDGEREHNYALAHALCYYLLRGAPAMGESRFAAIPRRYIEALRRSRNLDAARSEAFKGIDTRELAAKLKAFWRDRQQIQRAKRYRGGVFR